jgi:uncharacterized repeat protein (TIGR01451 family)
LSGATVTVSPAAATVGSAAGNGSFSLTLTPATAWTATSSAAWLTVNPANGAANATINYTFTANSSGNARMASILVAGKRFNVLQIGTSGRYTPWGSGANGQTLAVAGTGASGTFSGDGGAATAAGVNPQAVVVDPNGNVYIAENQNARVRRVDVTTGLISTVVGTGVSGSAGDGGAATSATIGTNLPALALDNAGNLFIADAGNNRIRRLDAATGKISTVAGTGASSFSGDNGLATAATFSAPSGVAVDAAGNLYISDTNNGRVRRVDAATGIITTFAGTGGTGFSGDGLVATSAQFFWPKGLAFDSAGSLYVADSQNARVRRIDAASNIISTVAGGGSAFTGVISTAASIGSPVAVALDSAGNLFITDSSNFTSRVDGVSSILTRVGNARMTSLATDGSGNVYGPSGQYQVLLLDQTTPRITLAATTAAETQGAGTDSVGFTISPAGAFWVAASNAAWLTVTTPSGTGSGTVGFSFTPNSSVTPRSASVSIYGQSIAVTQAGAAVTLSISSATASAAAGSGTVNLTTTPAVAWAASSSAAWLTLSAYNGSGNTTLTFSYTANTGTNARTATLTIAGKTVPVLQVGTSGTYTPWGSTGYGTIRTIAGSGTSAFGGDAGPATLAGMSVSSMALDSSGNVFIADSSNYRIRRVDVSTGLISTIAGTGIYSFSGDNGLATSATFYGPTTMALDSANNLYVIDSYRVRRIDAATGIITTVAGTGNYGSNGDGGLATAATIIPAGIALDAASNLYITDSYTGTVRRVDAGTGIIHTVAGGGPCCQAVDGVAAVSAYLSSPGGLATDRSGNLFIAESQRIRRVDAVTGIITTVAGGSFGYFGDGGLATSAGLTYPHGVWVDSGGNIWIADTQNYRIRRVDAATGKISTVAGNGNSGFGGDGGPAALAWLASPNTLAIDSSGNLYIGDGGNSRVRFVDFASPQTALGTSSVNVGAAAGNGSVSLTITPAGAAWQASSSAAWLTITNPSGSGNTTLSYSYSANNSVTQRSATISVYGATLTVTQAGAIATLSSSSATLGAAAGSTTTALTLTPAVSWTASSSASWLTVNPSSGNANATITLTFTANAGTGARSAAATIAGQRFTVLQLGSAGAYTPWGSSGFGQIRTIAGNGSSSWTGDGVPATSTGLSAVGVALDANGNLFIADSNNNRIRRVDAVTGAVTTVAGNGVSSYQGDGGSAILAALYNPTAVAVDGSGNLFIADTYNNRVRRVNAATGVISTVAGNGNTSFSGDTGLATAASLYSPQGLALDSQGNLFIAESSNHRIRRVDAATGIITTVAGNGAGGFSGDSSAATAASLWYPRGVTLDSSGNLYIADTSNYRIRRVDAATGIITTVAGSSACCGSGDGGAATAAGLSYPGGTAVDRAGNLYIADSNSNRVRRVDAASGIITTIAGAGGNGFSGDGGPAAKAALNGPASVALDATGNVYIADSGNYRVRFVDFTSPQLTVTPGSLALGTAAGAGSITVSTSPAGALWSATSSAAWLTLISASGAGNGSITYSYSANNSLTQRFATITAGGQVIVVNQAAAGATLTVSTATVGAAAGSGSVTLTLTPNVPWTATSSAAWLSINPSSGSAGGVLTFSFTANTGTGPRMGTLLIAGQKLTVLQSGLALAYNLWGSMGNGYIRTIAGTGGYGTSGDGGPALAALLVPSTVAAGPDGTVFVADGNASRIRKIDPATGVISTYAGTGGYGDSGDGGPATAAAIQAVGLAVDGAGNLFVSTATHRVRRIDASSGVITAVAGTSGGFGGDGGPATSASLSGPRGIAIDPWGNLLIADSGNNRIRKVDAGTGIITTLAGTGNAGFSGDGGPAVSASLNAPNSVASDNAGNLFIADYANARIRRVDAATGAISTMAGSGCCGSAGDGGPATVATLNAPGTVALDAAGNIYIGDSSAYKVRRIDAGTGIISTAAGSGSSGYNGEGIPARTAGMTVNGLAVDPFGNLFIADSGNDRIRFVDASTPQVTLAQTTVSIGAAAGNGSVGITIAPAGAAWIATSSAAWLTLTTGSGTGSGTIAYSFTANSSLNPRTATISAFGQTLTVTQAAVTASLAPSSLTFSAAAGNASVVLTLSATAAWTSTSLPPWLSLSTPSGSAGATITVSVTANGGMGARSASLSIAGQTLTVLQLGPAGDYTPWGASGYGLIRTIAGNGSTGFSGDGVAATATSLNLGTYSGIAFDPAGNLYIADTSNRRVRKLDASTGLISTFAGTGSSGTSGNGGPATAAQFTSPAGLAVDSVGNVFVADSGAGAVRRIDSVTGVITLAAGGYTGSGGDGGPATSAGLYQPEGIALDRAGNLYIADQQNNRVRRVDAASGIITTVAGSGLCCSSSGDGGLATLAGLNYPSSVAVDSVGNLLIAEINSSRVRRVDALTGIITTVAGTTGCCYSGGDGGPATSAGLYYPDAVTLDSAGNIFIADTSGQKVRRVDALTGIITTFAGNGSAGFRGDGGPAANAMLYYPGALAFDASGNLYIADTTNRRIRFVDLTSPTVSLSAASANLAAAGGTGTINIAITPAGAAWTAISSAGWLTPTPATGTGAGSISFSYSANTTVMPRSATVSVFGQTISFIQAATAVGLSPTSAVVTATAGSGSVTLTTGSSVAWTAVSNSAWLTVTTPSGTGGGSVGYSYTANVGSAPRTGIIVIAGQPFAVTQAGTGGAYVRWGLSAAGRIQTIAGNGQSGYSGDGGPATAAQLSSPQNIAVDPAGNVLIADGGRLRRVDATTGVITTISTGQNTAAVAVDGSGNIFVLTTTNLVFRVDAVTGSVTSVTVPFSLSNPGGIASDSTGNLYIADTNNNRVIRYDVSSGLAAIIAGTGIPGNSGDGGPASLAKILTPYAVALDRSGNVYFADGNSVIRKVDANSGVISTIAGAGSGGDGGPAISASLTSPRAVAVDSAGNVYIGGYYRVRRVDASTGIISTAAGNGSYGFSGDGGPAVSAWITNVFGLAVDPGGNLYLADIFNYRIRFVDYTSPVTNIPTITNAASSADYSAPPVAPGSLVSLFGTLLANSTATAAGAPYAASLAGVSVTVNGVNAPVQFVSAGQINIQIPFGTSVGAANVIVVNNGIASNPFSLAITSAAPSIYSGIYNQDTSYNTRATPAPPATTLVVRYTGAGATNPPLADGAAAPASPLAVPSPVTATINGFATPAANPSLVPGLVGIAQVSVTVPASLLAGSYPLILTVNGRPSASATVWVSGAAPSILSVSPSVLAAGSPTTNVTISGSNLAPGSVISWTSPTGQVTSITPFSLQSAQAAVSISSSLLASAGTAHIAVTNALGAASNSLPFVITATPFTISAITPAYQTVNSPATPVTIAGSNLATASTVSFTAPGGQVTNFAASLVQSAMVQATLPAAVLTSAGTAQVALANGSGSVSNTVPFLIAAFPITSVTPVNVLAGSAATQITIAGQGLTTAAKVYFTSSSNVVTALVPDQVQAAQVTVTLPAGILTTSGTAQIALADGSDNLSNSLAFTVNPFLIGSVTPASLPVGSPSTSVTVNGANLTTASKLYFWPPGGQPVQISPSLVQAAMVAATIPSSVMSTAGTAQIALADGSGTLSNQLPFTITGAFTGSAVSLALSANAIAFGQTVTLTATVSPPGATGAVTFYDGVTILGTRAISGGQATFTTLLPAGTRGVRAFYSGDSFTGAGASATLPVTVTPAPAFGFVTGLNQSTAGAAYAITAGDFNGDGIPDLAVANDNGASNGTLSVLLGLGNGNFAPAVLYQAGLNPRSVATGDFNRDGKPDLVVANSGSANISIFLGNGGGTFQPAVNIAAGTTPQSVAVADFNADGKADFVVADNAAGIMLLTGDGLGGVANTATFSAGTAPVYAAVGDFNGDGRPDVAVAGSGGVTILLRTASNSFTSGGLFAAGTGADAIAVGEFSGDGAPDLAVANRNSANVSVLINNGAGAFASAVNYATGSSPYSVVTGDFNGDGVADLAVVNAGSNNVSILNGNGNGTFRAAVSTSVGNFPYAAVTGEFNGDARSDLAVASFNDQSVIILAGATPVPDLVVAKSHSGNLIRGQQGAQYSIAVSNVGGSATAGTVSVTDTLPAGMTATAVSGTGWICTLATLTCTRSDALASQASYPAITVTVNVAAAAAASLTNTASVSGGGESNLANDTASDVTTIVAPGALTITGPGSLPAGIMGAAYSATITATGGTGGYSWSASGLPGGLVINAATGVISGTPNSVVGSPFSVTVTVTDSSSGTSSVTLPLTVLLAPLVSFTAGNGAGLSGGTAEIPIQIALQGAASPAALQIDITFDAQKLTFASVRVGPQATSAGKSVTANATGNNTVRLLVSGVNQTAIATGITAYATFNLSQQFTTGTTPLTLLNCAASDASGNLVAASCGAAATIKTPPACDINADQKYTVSDIQLIVNEALAVTAAVDDLNHDGKVDVADVQTVINAILGLGCAAP